MRQYLDAKQQHRDALLLFRMGDFYEMFYEDALVGSRALELTLTSRSKDANGGGIPMCGVPFHAVESYVARLVRKGFRVAICDQVEDPRKAKGIVKREVVRVVSPGTFTDSSYLEAKEPAFLIAISPRQQDGPIGLALLDVSTGEFSATEYEGPDAFRLLLDELSLLRPRELVVPADEALEDPAAARRAIAARWPALAEGQWPVTPIEGWAFETHAARRTLLDQLRAAGLEGFGLDRRPAAVSAAGGLLHYLRATQKADLAHVRAIVYRQRADALVIDPATLKHLEILEGAEGDRHGSLLQTLDRTITSMGGRMLRAWLQRPLLVLDQVRDRLDAVEELAFRTIERGKFRDALKSVQDLERLVAKAALRTAGPRDLVGLSHSIAAIPRARAAVGDLGSPLLRSLVAELDDLADVRDRIESLLVSDPPALARDGGFTRDGVDAELDELTAVSRSGKASRNLSTMPQSKKMRFGSGSTSSSQTRRSESLCSCSAVRVPSMTSVFWFIVAAHPS